MRYRPSASAARVSSGRLRYPSMTAGELTVISPTSPGPAGQPSSSTRVSVVTRVSRPTRPIPPALGGSWSAHGRTVIVPAVSVAPYVPISGTRSASTAAFQVRSGKAAPPYSIPRIPATSRLSAAAAALSRSSAVGTRMLQSIRSARRVRSVRSALNRSVTWQPPSQVTAQMAHASARWNIGLACSQRAPDPSPTVGGAAEGARQHAPRAEHHALRPSGRAAGVVEVGDVVRAHAERRQRAGPQQVVVAALARGRRVPPQSSEWPGGPPAARRHTSGPATTTRQRASSRHSASSAPARRVFSGSRTSPAAGAAK